MKIVEANNAGITAFKFRKNIPHFFFFISQKRSPEQIPIQLYFFAEFKVDWKEIVIVFYCNLNFFNPYHLLYIVPYATKNGIKHIYIDYSRPHSSLYEKTTYKYLIFLNDNLHLLKLLIFACALKLFQEFDKLTIQNMDR